MSNYLEEHGYDAYLHAAMKTLKECPLCDGKAIYSSGSHFGHDEEFGRIYCDDCGLELRVKLYGYGNYDPLHAFDPWNTRAERTCHEKWVDGSVSGTCVPVCSECGRSWHVAEQYCPNCGARVVER